MRQLKLSKAFTLMESGPVVLVTTHDGHKDNIMTTRKEKRTIHAVGDGTFIVDGRKIDRRQMMASKLPCGG